MDRIKDIFLSVVHWVRVCPRWDMGVYVCIFFLGVSWTIITYWQYEEFAYNSADTAVAEQAIWNTLQGRFFEQSALELEEGSNFREHLNFSRFLFLPFYALVPHTVTLFFVIHIFFVIGGIVLYRYSQKKIGRFGAVLVTCLFLFHPLTASQLVGSMHVAAIAGPIFLFLLIAYYEKRLKLFLSFVFLTLLVSEFVYPTVFLVGALAFLEKRTWYWYLPPAVGSLGMYFFAKTVITIGFGSHASIVEKFSVNTLSSIKKLSTRIDFILDFLKPTLYIIPFLSRYAFLLLPSFLVALIIIEPGRLKTGGHVFILVPAILAMIVIDLSIRWSGWKKNILYGMVIFGIVFSFHSWWKWMEIDGSALAEEMRGAVSMVKDGGSVTASTQFGVHLNRRAEFYLPQNKQFTDYVVLKTSKYSKEVSYEEKRVYEGEFIQSHMYREVYREDRVVVFAKKTKISEVFGKDESVIERMSDDVLRKEWSEFR